MRNTIIDSKKNATYNCKNVGLSKAVLGLLNGDCSQWWTLEDYLRAVTCYPSVGPMIRALAGDLHMNADAVKDDIVTVMKIRMWDKGQLVLRRLASMDDDHIGGYLYRMVCNQCASEARAYAKRVDCIVEDFSKCPDVEDDTYSSLVAEERDAALRRCIELLPNKQKEAMNIWLQYEREDYSNQEMAELAQVSKSAFGKNLCLAKANLAKLLKAA